VTDAPFMSVVVMGYLDRATIVDAVGSIIEQQCEEPFEVMVVTSGGDGSAALVRERFPDLTVIDSPPRLLPGGTRNVGTAATTGSFVAFLAGDCIAQPGWVAARVVAHRRGHAAVASAVATAPPQNPSAWALHFDMYCHRLVGRAAGPVAASDPAAHGLSFDRALLERIGRFDDTVERNEDTIAATLIGELGIGIWFEPAIVTAHHGPPGSIAMVRDARRRSELAARVAHFPDAGPVSWATVLGSFGQMWWRGIRRRAATAWRYGDRTERTRLVLSLPWLGTARAAALVGWYSVRLGGSESNPREMGSGDIREFSGPRDGSK
jgi:hypothetical protein